MDSNQVVDVLVIGAGPTGLTLACDLARHGLRVRIADQEKEPPPWSKAQIVHARTLEILETLGIAEALRSTGKFIHGVNVYESPSMKKLAHFTLGRTSSEAGSFLSIPQRETERCLAQALEARGVIPERPVRLETFLAEEGGVTATLAHADGSKETVKAAYLVGCDGAHSTTRDVMGFTFAGSTYETRLIQADVRIDMPIHTDDDEIAAFLANDGIVALFPLPGERRYRMLVPLLDGQDLEPKLETFQDLMKRWGSPDANVSDPVWMVGFRIHCKMVSQYRKGRVFIAGDAAHIHSPAGGQGMNTGIQDAHNLAWKLALVHKGKARAELLDSYDAERKPVAAATLAMTDITTRRGFAVFQIRHPIAIAMRNRLLGFVGSLGVGADRAAQGVSMLEIGYPDSPVVAQDRPRMLDTRVMSSGAVESPSLRDWVDFGSGPAPGYRAPDVRILPSHEESPRLHDFLHSTAHTLLLFDGAAHTDAGYANLTSIAARVKERYGEVVRAIAVVPMAEKPATFAWTGDIVLDAEGAVHQSYGARSECLYLIRPDGHVAYRSQPANAEQLLAYLARIFIG
jgi:2-polyprenyl-6-methoxyphenol hydroxylase-like FAD-dependent oxidoreductase